MVAGASVRLQLNNFNIYSSFLCAGIAITYQSAHPLLVLQSADVSYVAEPENREDVITDRRGAASALKGSSRLA